MHLLYLQQLLVIPGSPGNNRSWEMACYWTKAGHRITFITSEAAFPDQHNYFHTKEYPHYFEYEGIGIWVLNIPYSHFMPFRNRIFSFLSFYRQAFSLGKKLSGFDAIFAYSAPLSVGELGRKLAIHHQLPFFFEVADVWPDVPIGMKLIRNPLMIHWLQYRTRKIYTQAELIFTFSEDMKAQILSHDVPAKKVHVIHNGVNPEQISFVSRKDKKSGDVEVIYLGTIGIANGLDQLVRAAWRIEKTGRKDIIWTIIGDGNDGDRVRQLAENLGLKSMRFFSSIPREEVAQRLASADIGVISFAPFPVLQANGATKFFDYMANGLPIVINYEGWQAQYLSAYQCGLAAVQGDEKAFVEQLVKLADDQELRIRMGENGHALSEKLFNRKTLAGRMANLIENQLRQNRL